jgi:hypothetical protein
MGDFFNHLMDNIIAASWRLMDLPMYVLMILLILVFVLFYFLLLWLLKRYRLGRKVVLRILLPVLGLMLVSFMVDFKISQMKREVELINQKYMNFRSNEKLMMWDQQYNIHELTNQFGEQLYLDQRFINEATKLFIFRKEDPKAVIYLTVTDLSYPGLEIMITPEFKEKYLTSKFAIENECYIAINGEAGESMAIDCDLGEWTGNWIVKNRPVLLEDSDKRPFLSFDRNNRATYFKAPLVDTTVTEEKYNTIWGRFDILLDGEIQPDLYNRPYSRTIMGIDREGKYLYMMVVDGKRPQYSLGLTTSESARLLKLLGAWNVMYCDQGGSSCMYLKNYGGIINRPADSDGSERPVYSHFGLSLKDTKQH